MRKKIKRDRIKRNGNYISEKKLWRCSLKNFIFAGESMGAGSVICGLILEEKVYVVMGIICCILLFVAKLVQDGFAYLELKYDFLIRKREQRHRQQMEEREQQHRYKIEEQIDPLTLYKMKYEKKMDYDQRYRLRKQKRKGEKTPLLLIIYENGLSDEEKAT